MTWLHPRQARLVAQRWSGPARIRGAAGTGKTVVALHRAKHLAASGKRVLFTSFVRTLPAVHQQLFARLAPDVPGRVEFVGLHAWARRLLASRGVRLDLSDGRTCFNLAWSHVGRGSVLDDLSVPRDYWREEITSVIKGRGITAYDDYAALTRVGRRTALQPVHREAVWRLFLEYERLRVERGQHDFADLLLLALESVQASPVTPAYDAVIVDEVQDLSCVGLRLLHALVGDAPDGLLLVGDGQQAVYPGGFTLVEAGVSVVGRSRVLDRNYRNGSAIVAAALSVVAQDVYDDLEADPFSGAREVDVERSGGRVIRAVAASASEQAAALVAAIAAECERGARLGDLAVLCPSNAEVSPLARDAEWRGPGGDRAGRLRRAHRRRGQGRHLPAREGPRVRRGLHPRPQPGAGAASRRRVRRRLRRTRRPRTPPALRRHDPSPRPPLAQLRVGHTRFVSSSTARI